MYADIVLELGDACRVYELDGVVIGSVYVGDRVEGSDDEGVLIMNLMSVTWKCINESIEANAVGNNRCLDHRFRTERR